MNLDRFNHMRFQTKRLLSREYELFLAYSRSPVVDRWAANYLPEKLGGNPARAQFAVAISDWLLALKAPWYGWTLPASKRRLLTAQLPFVFEIVISIQYLHNQVLDGKAGVVNTARISDNLLLANLLKEQLYRYLEGELPPRYRTLVTRQVRQCFEWVDLGQQLELQANRYDRMHQHELRELLPPALYAQIDLQVIQAFIDKTKQDLPRFLHGELDHYFYRIYLTCAALFVHITQLTGRLLKVPAARLRAPLQFSVCYGIMRQLVNDNADWVSNDEQLRTQEKHPADAASDLRNKTLTLPLFYWLATAQPADSVIGQVLRDQRAWEPALRSAVFTEMLDSQALFRSVQHTRILAELALAFLPPDRTTLAKACDIAHWNKFLVPVLRHPSYRLFRKTASHRRTKRLIKQLRQARQQPSRLGPGWQQWVIGLQHAASASALPLPARRAMNLLRG